MKTNMKLGEIGGADRFLFLELRIVRLKKSTVGSPSTRLVFVNCKLKQCIRSGMNHIGLTMLFNIN